MSWNDETVDVINEEAREEETMTINNAAAKSDEDNEEQSGLPRIQRKATGEIFALINDKAVAVQLFCCFPWTNNRRYISLRDYDGNEVALIGDLETLDDESRYAIEQAITETGFVLEVTSIEALETEFEIRNWKVQTKQGRCTFQTALDSWPRIMSGGGLLFRDIVGNLYHIPHPHDLDEKSRKHLWPFLD